MMTSSGEVASDMEGGLVLMTNDAGRGRGQNC